MAIHPPRLQFNTLPHLAVKLAPVYTQSLVNLPFSILPFSPSDAAAKASHATPPHPPPRRKQPASMYDKLYQRIVLIEITAGFC